MHLRIKTYDVIYCLNVVFLKCIFTPNFFFLYVEEIHFSSPLHQHSEKKEQLVIKQYINGSERKDYNFPFVFRNHQEIKEQGNIS